MAFNARTEHEENMPKVDLDKRVIVKIKADVTEGNDTGFAYAYEDEVEDKGFELYTEEVVPAAKPKKGDAGWSETK